MNVTGEGLAQRQGIRLVSKKMLVWFCVSSPLLKRVVVCGHCLVRLSLTINATLKCLSSLPILRQESFWWWQCSVRYHSVSLFPHLLGSRSLPVPRQRQIGVKPVLPNRECHNCKQFSQHNNISALNFNLPSTILGNLRIEKKKSKKDIKQPRNWSHHPADQLTNQP